MASSAGSANGSPASAIRAGRSSAGRCTTRSSWCSDRKRGAVDLAARRCFWRARPKPDLLAGDAVVERLSSEGIAREQQGPRLLVPEGHRERAAQAVQRALAVLGKETRHLVGADFPGEQQTLLDFPGQIEVSVHALGPSG